ncbi:mitochondrial ornithine transporter 1-like isoform X2 [Artemia franciscana]
MQTFPDIHKNMVSCFVETFRKEGIRGLYAGTTPALVANIAENSVLFGFYGVCQKLVLKFTNQKRVEELNPLGNAVAGSLAAFFCSFTLCPTELVKCRLQAQMETEAMKQKDHPRVKIGPLKMTESILKTEGIRGLFHGLSATVAREMPGYFVLFGGMEVTKHLLTPPGKTKEEIGPVKTVVAGGMGGICFWTFIFPFDVVKSRMQVAGSGGGIFPVLMKIFRNEGILALYNGLGPTLVRTFPATGALILTYETTKKYMNEAIDTL